jgi:hypothetical protein
MLFNSEEHVFHVNTSIKLSVMKEVRWAIRLNDRICTCGKWQTFHHLCSHVLAWCAEITQFVNDYYTVQSYRLAYDNSFRPLPNKLEWTNYTGPRVEADSSRWKLGRGWWMSTDLHNEMDAREGHAHYRCGICNDTGYNKKKCHNRQRIYNNSLDYVMIYYDIFLRILYLYNFTSITSTITQDAIH